MRPGFVALLLGSLAATAAVLPAAAATAVPPPGGTARDIPWELAGIALAGGAAALAVWRPALRRPAAAAAVFAAALALAWLVLLGGAVSSMDTGGGIPAWAIGGATLIVVAGGILAAKIVRAGRSTPREAA